MKNQYLILLTLLGILSSCTPGSEVLVTERFDSAPVFPPTKSWRAEQIVSTNWDAVPSVAGTNTKYAKVTMREPQTNHSATLFTPKFDFLEGDTAIVMCRVKKFVNCRSGTYGSTRFVLQKATNLQSESVVQTVPFDIPSSDNGIWKNLSTRFVFTRPVSACFGFNHVTVSPTYRDRDDRIRICSADLYLDDIIIIKVPRAAAR